MSRKGKILTGIGIVLFLALVVWAVRSVPGAPPAQQNTDPSHVMSYDGNTISEEKNGRKLWELTADHIEMDMDTKNASMTGITGHFYEDDGRVVDVTAQKASYDAQTKNVTIEGGIAITTSDGAALKSDQLFWIADDETLTAKGNAYVAKDDMQASGGSISSSNGFKKIEIDDHVYIVKGDMQATGDKLESDDGIEKIRLIGHAHITKG